MLKKVKTAVFVSGGGTNLQALIDFEKNGGLKHAELSLCVATNNEAYALTRAKNAGIKSEVVIKKQVPLAEFEKKLSEILIENKIELIVLAGFLTVLSAEFVKKWDRRILNVHPSLIPSFCGDGFYGLKVHEAALERGVKLSGATVHFVNEITDGGEIIMQKAVKVLKKDTPEVLQQRVMREAEWIILPKSLEKVAKDLKGDKNENI